MNTRRSTICTIAASLLAFGGCATSPEEEQRRLDMEADIDEIVGYELDKSEYGEPKHCLSSNEYRSFRALGKRHLLFEGRQGKQWINVLRGSCSGLNKNSKFIMRPSSAGRACDKDLFEVFDNIDPMSGSIRGPTCSLGMFIPAAKFQVDEIEDRLEMR